MVRGESSAVVDSDPRLRFKSAFFASLSPPFDDVFDGELGRDLSGVDGTDLAARSNGMRTS